MQFYLTQGYVPKQNKHIQNNNDNNNNNNNNNSNNNGNNKFETKTTDSKSIPLMQT